MEKTVVFSWLNFQPIQNPQQDFGYYIVTTEIDKFLHEICLQIIDLLSKSFEFRLSIVVIIKNIIKNIIKHTYMHTCNSAYARTRRKIKTNEITRRMKLLSPIVAFDELHTAFAGLQLVKVFETPSKGSFREGAGAQRLREWRLVLYRAKQCLIRSQLKSLELLPPQAVPLPQRWRLFSLTLKVEVYYLTNYNKAIILFYKAIATNNNI